MDWTNGYVSEVDYTYGYYSELNPTRVTLSLLYAGIKPPIIKNACELGFGQGVSILSHSAASGIHWYGTDFNPNQVAFALDAKKAASLQCELFDQDFAKFTSRSDLPDFDFIGLHGIWSWVSNENRANIVNFIKNRLKVGGVVYLSYNSLPGRSGMIPLRELMLNYAELNCAAGDTIVSKIDQSIQYVQSLVDANSRFMSANPLIAKRFEEIKNHGRDYLAHEYFNKDWCPMSFADVAKQLEEAKLHFVASADMMDAIDGINFTNEQLNLISSSKNQIMREMTKDFFRNQGFRKDYWIKGVQKLTPKDRQDRLGRLSILLVKPIEKVDLKIITNLGEAELNEEVYRPFLKLLNDRNEVSVSDAFEGLKGQLSLRQLIEATAVLVGKGVAEVIQDKVSIKESEATARKLNDHLSKLSFSRSDLHHLVCSLTGGAVMFSRFEQLFLRALSKNFKTSDEIAKYTWNILKPQGHKIKKGDTTLESDDENLSELAVLAEAFLNERGPIVKKLKIKL